MNHYLSSKLWAFEVATVCVGLEEIFDSEFKFEEFDSVWAVELEVEVELEANFEELKGVFGREVEVEKWKE